MLHLQPFAFTRKPSGQKKHRQLTASHETGFRIHLLLILVAFIAAAIVAHRYDHPSTGLIERMILFFCACAFTLLSKTRANNIGN